MVVCKFYQQGYCKFGNTCRYEHSSHNSYGRYENDYYQNRSPPTYHSNKIPQELQEAVRSVQDDIVRSEKGGQWPLSCYAPFKQRPCIPEWQDFSPEEVRWMFYQAAATGNVEACNLQVKELLRNDELRKAQLLNPTPEIYSLLDKVYKGEINDPLTFSFVQSSNTAETGGSSTSVFGAGQSAGLSGNINNFSFSLPQLDQGQATNVFSTSSSMVHNVNADFQQESIFGNAAAQQGNAFGSGSTSTANLNSVYGGGSQPSGVFGQQSSAVNFSFEAPAASSPSNVFTAPSKSVFDSSSVSSNPSSLLPNPSISSSEDTAVYSVRSELSEEDITQFLNPTFSLSNGKIPIKPPSRDLCTL